jgi:hypothetical protein
MSNPLAIAAVTATLRNLLTKGLATDPDLADATVTMQPLDRARVNGNNANQMNVFLYHVLPNGAWRNLDMPGQVRSGETGVPVLGLNLYYLLTAFGRDNDTQRPFSHQLMGRAMSVLNDHPLLGADEIKTALPNNDLWKQIERVRFTLQPFSVEEIAKLWTGFQTVYRLSVAYEAAVVLIESARPARTPLPVLMRGAGDSGIIAQANLLSPFPTIDELLIDELLIPGGQPTASLGSVLTLNGHNLVGDQSNVQFSNRFFTTPVPVLPEKGGTDSRLTVQIPNKAADWPAGMYTVAVVVTQGKDDRISNVVAVPVAPQITSKLPMNAKAVNGNVTLKLTCSPEVRPEQHAALLLGGQEVSAAEHPAQTKQLSFAARGVAAGEYFIRLRVDGVDSQLIDLSSSPPKFHDKQKVVIT